jgi:hypothetical protein
MPLRGARVKSRSSTARWLRFVATLGILGISQLVFLAPSASAANLKCSNAPSPPYVAAKTVTTLTPENDRTTKPPAITFGTSRASQNVAPYTFTVTGPAPVPAKMSWDFLLVNGNETFPTSGASVTFSNVFGNLRVKLCLTPAGVPAGSYSGSLTLAGPGVKPVELPLTVNLKDNNLPFIWLGIIVSAVAAIFFKWWTMKVVDTNEPNNGASVKELFTWIGRQWLTVLIAVIGAAGGVYITKFQDADSFVPGDRWELWVTTFTAVMSASLLLNALGVAVEPSTDAKPKPAH